MRKPSRSDLLLATLGLAGLVIVVLLYESAFPLALVELQVTREEAIERATEFIAATEADADLGSYRRAEVFAGDTESLIFLQRALGNEEAGRWARELVPVWRWDIRWFRPLEREEWFAEVGVDGEVVGFRHVIEEAAPGADLDEPAARAVAEEFLTALGHDVAQLEAVQATAERKDNRTDHVFGWQVRGQEIEWAAGDSDSATGSARIQVRVQGDRVGGYVRYLRVPESFSRTFQNTVSKGQFLAVGSIVLMVVMALWAMVLAILRFKSGTVAWRPAVTCAVLVAVMFVIASATTWPTVEFNYRTEISWGVFVGVSAAGLLLLALLFYVVPVTFATAAGDSLARELFPDSLRGFGQATRGRLLTPSFGRAAFRGYALAVALMGYFTLFYWFAQRYLGAWLPAEGPYSQVFNNALPFLTPLTISLVAAISEETIYRLFGISAFRKLTRSTVLALLVPAAIWAFGHSNYPVFPVYIRGIELTIAGVLFGLAFLQYGLVTCIIAHYVIDAVALGLPLLTSGNDTYLITGLVVIALAAVPGVLGLVAGRGRESQAAA